MPTAIEPGAVIDGKYRVLRLIGEGGMGTVYEGENVRIERRVAIKVLHAHVAASSEFAQRFEREARTAARINSPHVCDVLDLGDFPNGERFIVMEFLDGESLEERLEKGRLTAAELAPIAFEILEGLGTMHRAGVVHRDLKPANVFLARGTRKRETVKILDFGIAKLLPRADEPSQMTSTGMMMGTPLYMSPEQARGARDVDGRTDLYAASVIFYRALTGALPHAGANLHELLFKIVLEEPRPIREFAPDIDENFAAIIMKGLAREADQRYATARAYQEEIAAWGAAQGRASLRFTLTLASELLAARPSEELFRLASDLGDVGERSQPRAETVGPPTPSDIRNERVVTPSTKQSGGTPIVWSEDAPDFARRAFAHVEGSKQSEGPNHDAMNAGKTQILPGSRSGAASHRSASYPEVQSAEKRRSQGKSRVAMVGGAALVVGIAAIGLRLRAQSGSSTTSGATSAAGSSSSLVAPPEPSTTILEPTEHSLHAPEPPGMPATTNVEPLASTTATSAQSLGAHPMPRPASVPTTVATPVASVSVVIPSTSSSAVTTPLPTTKSRKFRTNLD